MPDPTRVGRGRAMALFTILEPLLFVAMRGMGGMGGIVMLPPRGPHVPPSVAEIEDMHRC